MNVLELFRPIKTFVFDIDGVLTNSQLLATEEGNLLRSVNIKDGYAIQLAVKKGYNLWIISGGTSVAMQTRFQNLGMKDIEDQSVHLMFPAGVAVLHAHCSSATLTIGPKIEMLQIDSYEVRIPLLNPGDKLMVRLLMTGNEAGRILVTAKGPGLKFKSFDPTTFISPAVNRGLLVMSGLIFAWIFWACAGTDRFMARPLWDKTITLVLIGLLLALPSAILAYQGTIPLLKRALQWRAGRKPCPLHTPPELLS